MDEFNELYRSLEQLIESIYAMGDAAGSLAGSELNDWETPHRHVLGLMAPFDGLDFYKFPQRDYWFLQRDYWHDGD